MAEQIKTKTIVVIIVEDEPVIRMSSAYALADDGFDVIVAAHAREAIAILELEANRVHALFTDVHMPGDLDGIGLAQHARRHWPWLSLLVTSGLAHPEPGVIPLGARFISKPYEVRRVISHIREMHAAR